MSEQLVTVKLSWHPAKFGLFSNWYGNNCVYAYHIPPFEALVHYIGEAVNSTPWDRYQGHEKDGLNDKVRLSAGSQGFNIFIAYPIREDGKQVTAQLIHDIESVLIYYLQPFENEKKKKSINVNYPLSIENKGEWPFIQKSVYHDGKVVTDPFENFMAAMMRARMAQSAPSQLTNFFSLNPFGGNSTALFLGKAFSKPTPSTIARPNSLSDILSQARAFENPGALSLMKMVSDLKAKK